MNDRNKNALTFPQRNWLLLCLLVAIISAGITYYAVKKNTVTQNSNEIKTTNSSAINGQDSSRIPPDSLPH